MLSSKGHSGVCAGAVLFPRSGFPVRGFGTINLTRTMPINHSGRITARLDNRRASLGHRPQRPFIVPGLRPGRLGVISGVGASSKSYLMLLACVQVAAGLPVLGGLWGPPVAGGRPVVFVSREDDLEDLEDRLGAITKELKLQEGPAFEAMVRNLVVCDARSLDRKAGHGIIFPTGEDGSEIPPVLVVIDTLSRFLPAGTNENDSGQMTHFIESIEDVIAGWGAACVMIHHTNKLGIQAEREDSDPQGTERGSVAITFAARSAWALRKLSKARAAAAGIPEVERDNVIVLIHTKVNHCPRHPIQWFKKNADGVPVSFTPPGNTRSNSGGPSQPKARGSVAPSNPA